MNIWQQISAKDRPFSVLAPMDDVTDSIFRRIIDDCAPPDLYFTEFANADGLQSNGREAVMQKLHFTESEHPLIAQIWGLDEDAYEQTAREVVELGFDGLDINMGCPVPVVTKKGACSALIQTPDKAAGLIAAAKRGLDGRIPISVKTRIGFKQIQTEEWLSHLLRQGIDALIVHGRTSKEMSKVPVHWEELAKLQALRDEIAPETVIVANGDILTRREGEEHSRAHGFDGYMIARGVFQDPYVFSEKPTTTATADKIQLYIKHIKLHEQTWGDSKNPVALKKFAKMYLREFEGASQVRADFMNATSFAAMVQVLEDSLSAIDSAAKTPTPLG